MARRFWISDPEALSNLLERVPARDEVPEIEYQYDVTPPKGKSRPYVRCAHCFRPIHWKGNVWSTESGGTAAYLSAVWGSSGADVWALGYYRELLHWNGSTWAETPAGWPYLLAGIWSSSADDVWAVGSSGTILHWNGLTWSESTSGTDNYLGAVWGSSGDDVWAVGEEGTILHWNGMTWSPSTICPSPGSAPRASTRSSPSWRIGRVGSLWCWIYAARMAPCGGSSCSLRPTAPPRSAWTRPTTA